MFPAPPLMVGENAIAKAAAKLCARVVVVAKKEQTGKLTFEQENEIQRVIVG